MKQPGELMTGRQRAAEATEQVVALLLAALVAGRCFLNETSGGGSLWRMAQGAASQGAKFFADRSELARVEIAVLLLVGVAAWAAAGAIRGAWRVRFGWAGLLAVMFALLTLSSAMQASNTREALTGWLEQVSLLAAGFLAAQVMGKRWGLSLAAMVLAGVAGAMVYKGLYQYFVEVPDRIAVFEADQAGQFAAQGITEGTPAARAFVLRVMDRTPTGFFGLANVLASLMLIGLAAATAAAVAKVQYAIRGWASWRQRRETGEVYAPAIAAAISVAIALAGAAVLVLTSSEAAIASAVAAGVGLAVVWQLGPWGQRHWKLVFVAGKVAVIAGVLAAVFLAAERGFGGRSLAFRMQYWRGAVAIIRERPLWGIGPGGFASAYLTHRQLGAEEEVRNPHNFVLHALSEYGLLGGACFLAAVVLAVVGAVRPEEPARDERIFLNGQGQSRAPPFGVALAAILAMTGLLVWRYSQQTSLAAAVFEWVLPMAALVLALVAAAWFGRGLELEWPVGPSRAFLAAGLIAFVLCDLLGFGFWFPATGLAFWMLAGACAGRGGRAKEIGPAAAAAVAVAMAAAVIAAAIWLVWPVAERTAMQQRMGQAASGSLMEAATWAEEAAEADKLDPTAAADAASVYLDMARQPGERRDSAIESARRWANEAARRDPGNFTWYQLAARAAALAGGAGAAETDLEHAVELNLSDARLRLELAGSLLAAGRAAEARQQLDEAARIDDALSPESIKRLTADERAELERLRGRTGG